MDYRTQPSPRLAIQQQQQRIPQQQQQQQHRNPSLPQTQQHHQIRRQPRISEIIEALKVEADQLIEGVNVYKVQRDEYEAKLQQQFKEQANIQASINELVIVSNKIKVQYEEEIMRLRRDLDNAVRALRRNSVQQIDEQAPQLPPNLKQQKGNEKSSMFGNLMDHSNKRFKLDDGLAQPVEQHPKMMPLDPPSQHHFPHRQHPSPMLVDEFSQIVQQPITSKCNLTPETTPSNYIQEGDGWQVLYNPNVAVLSGSRVKLDLVHTLEHQSVVCCVKFSNCGKYLATGANHDAAVFDVLTGERFYVLSTLPKPIIDESGERVPDLYIRSLAFSPEFKYLATGAEDHLIRVWDIAAQKIFLTLLGHDQEIYSLDWSRDGKTLLSGSGDACVKLWNCETGEVLLTMHNTNEEGIHPNPSEELNREDGVTSVSINPLYPHCVASGSLDQLVRVWDTQTGRLLEKFQGHQDSVYAVAFSPNGRSIISGSLDTSVKIWDLSDSTLDFFARLPASGENSGKEIGLPISLHPILTKTCRHTFAGHKDFVLSVAYVGTNGSFGRVDSEGNPVATKIGDDLAEVEWVISGSKDWTVTFWDARIESAGIAAAAEKPITTLGNAAQFMLHGHRNSVISVSPSPNGGLFATGAGDRMAKIWRVSSGILGNRTGPGNTSSTHRPTE